ncbi:MAG: transcriptional coactivator p15/PC4 family protein [Candidatus Obscuribacterales bacterium]
MSPKAQQSSSSKSQEQPTPTTASDRIRVHEKSRGETINVYLGEYAGRKYLHIREWYLDKDGEEKPTKKGVAIPIEKVAELRTAIEELLPD